MAGDPDEYAADLSFGDDELWEPAAAAELGDIAPAEPGDTLAQATAGAGSPPPGQRRPQPARASRCRAATDRDRARRRSRCPLRRFRCGSSRPPRGRRRASTGCGPRRRERAPLAESPTTTRTQSRSRFSPRTGLPAWPGPGIPPGARRRSARRPSTRTEAAAEANGAEAGAAEAGASPAAARAGAPGEVTGSGQDGRTAADAGADGLRARRQWQVPAPAELAPGKRRRGRDRTRRTDHGEARPAQGGERRGTGTGTRPAPPGAGSRRPSQARRPVLGSARRPLPAKATRGRTRRPPPGGARPPGCGRAGGSRSWPSSHSSSSPGRWPASASPVPAAGRPSRSSPWSPRIRPPWRRTRNWPAGRPGPPRLLASLTGIAAAGKTVVAIGAQPSQPAPVPLFLFSADGGRTWSRAALAAPGAGTGAGPAQEPGPARAAARRRRTGRYGPRHGSRSGRAGHHGRRARSVARAPPRC